MLLLLICKLMLYYGYNVYEINYFIIFSYCVNLYLCMMRVCFVNINVIILKSDNYCNSNNDDERFMVHSLLDSLDPSRKTIIIYYFEEFHFQLVGYHHSYIVEREQMFERTVEYMSFFLYL